MYLRRLFIQNNGPISRFNLDFPLNKNGSPKPIIFVGGNGSGKTNVLSSIADSLFEAAANHFTDIVPSSDSNGRPWFRVVGGITIRSGSAGACTVLQYEHEGGNYFYKEKAGKLNVSDVAELVHPEMKPHIAWEEEGNFKELSIPSEVSRNIFQRGSYLYFPSSRSEVPHWLNVNSITSDSFDVFPKFSSQLRKPIFVEKGLNQLKQWILSVLIEKRADFNFVDTPNGQIGVVTPAQLAGNQSGLWELLNTLLRAVLDDPTARFVWMGRHSGTKLGFIYSKAVNALPIESLSTGQATLLNIFGTLLRYSDTPSTNLSFENVTGICIVDEVDAHMHVDLQYNVLPNLISLFPNVQFFLSSHSPLFLLGMEQKISEEGLAIYDLPTGALIQTEAYADFGKAFQIFKETTAFDQALLATTKVSTKILVLLEGETDPIYLTTAVEILDRSTILEHIDFEWIGAKDPNNNSPFNTGKDGLNHTFNLLKAKPELVQRRVILLYDNDARKENVDHSDNLFIRSLPTNSNNQRMKCGIENLLPEEVLEDRMYDESKIDKGNGQVTITKSLNKMRLCQYLCTERRAKTDFESFASVIDMLEQLIRVDEEEIA